MNFLVCDLSWVDRPKSIGPNDRFISYEDSHADANWDSPIHPPISWHGYAAAMYGRIVSAPKDDWLKHVAWADTVLALWFYNPRIAMQSIQDMKSQGKVVIGAFHENGDTFQWLAKDINWLIDFKDCANMCDAILTYPRNSVFKEIYRSLGIRSELLHIPQPYYSSKRLFYMVQPGDRNGVFVGPRIKDNERERRNWIYNVTMAVGLVGQKLDGFARIENRITIINAGPIPNEKINYQLNALFKGYHIQVVSAVNYDAYLRLIATHQLTINLDSCDTQGQVDADSMFVGVPLYQSANLEFRTDFGDMYHDLLRAGMTDGEAISIIMNDKCSFSQVRNTINTWYNRVTALTL